MNKILALIVVLGLCGVHSQNTLSGIDLQVIQSLYNANNVLVNYAGWEAASNVNETAAAACSFYGIACFQNKIVSIQLQNIGLVSLPDATFNLTGVFLLNVTGNSITGSLTPYWNLGANREEIIVDLSNNGFTGNIPTRLSPKISVLHLDGNSLTGSIPSTISVLSQITVLDISDNQLTGSIPSSFGSLTTLTTFNASHNSLTGSLPATLNNMVQLKVFDISYNDISGTVPDLTNVVNLQVFYLTRNTKMTGLIPSFLKRYTEAANFDGIVFRCPVPSCQAGVECILLSLQFNCTCPCASMSYCVEGNVNCVCPFYLYGENCTQQCRGVVTRSGNVVDVCNGNGNCSSGFAGNGSCSCDSFYDKINCLIRCGGVSSDGKTACSGLGYCNEFGYCECDDKRSGVDCTDCEFGYSGIDCDVECEGGHINPCSGNGECSMGSSGTGACTCYDGWEGSGCDKRTKTVTGLAVSLAVFLFAALLLVALILFIKRKDIKTRLAYIQLPSRSQPKGPAPKVADYS